MHCQKTAGIDGSGDKRQYPAKLQVAAARAFFVGKLEQKFEKHENSPCKKHDRLHYRRMQTAMKIVVNLGGRFGFGKPG